MRILYALFSAFVLCLLVAGGAAFWTIRHYGEDLPDFRQLADYQPPTVTRVHAGDGRLLAEFATERRVFIPVEAMPKRVLHAFISAEDQNFYHHPGVDFLAVIRAAITNVGNVANDRRLVGASGITQQVAKNFLLTNEVSLERKIKEAILAFRIEKAFTKDRILELYLNEIFLGQRSYGVAAAALNYFNKSLDELTIAEVAYLAALPKAPSNYHPVRQYDAAVARRNWVIGRMQEDGYISADEARAARAEPLLTRRRDETEMVVADYFAEEVRRELAALYGDVVLYEGGLSVRTTVSPHLQDIATCSLRTGLIAYDRRHGWRGPVARLDGFDDWRTRLSEINMPPGGEIWELAVVVEMTATTADIGFADGRRGQIPVAELKWARRAENGRVVGPEVRTPDDALDVGDVILVEALPGQNAVASDSDGKPQQYTLRQIPEVQGGLVALDPHTGRVLAMTGGFSSSISVFNRATQALRQPGSAFKPFVYLAALDSGFTPSSLVLDAPFSLDQGAGLGKWRPSNYSDQFYGPTPLRVGIEKSRNVMTVRLAQKIGMDRVAEYAERFGIVDDMPEVLSMSLGAGETTVLRLTAAYAMLVNGGKRIEPTFIDRVQDHTGRTIYRRDDRACIDCRDISWRPGLPLPDVPDDREQVADPRTAYQIVSMLEGVVQRGTGQRISAIGKPLAGKTGTTNDEMDAWFVGFSPDLAVGVYVGFDNPRPLGRGETGSGVAAPIFKDFMEEALADQPATPFRVPPGLRLVRVDPQTGELAPPGTRGAIWEAFIPGTEPTSGETVVLDGGTQEAGGGGFTGGSGGNAPAATTGTGGLY